MSDIELDEAPATTRRELLDAAMSSEEELKRAEIVADMADAMQNAITQIVMPHVDNPDLALDAIIAAATVLLVKRFDKGGTGTVRTIVHEMTK